MSCQRKDMSFEKVNVEPNLDEEGYWKKKTNSSTLTLIENLNNF